MATVKAFVRTSVKKGFVNVRFRLTDGRSVQLFHKSDIQVNPNDFDGKKETIKAKVIFNEKARKEFNKAVSVRKDLINEIYLNATDKGSLTSDWLETEIDKKLNPEKYIVTEQQPDTVIRYIDSFISKAPQRKKKNDNTFIRESTIKSYKANRNRLKAFAEFKRKEDFTFAEFNKAIVDEYINFLTDTKRTVKTKRGEVVNELKQYTNNTIGDAIKTLKTMLADAKGLMLNLSDLYVYKEEIHNIYLNETELQKLKDFDFSNKPYLDRVRDGFLCLAWTCSRISDIGKVNNIRNGMIYYNQQKTNKKVVIPVHPVVDEILKKYDGNLPIISDQKFNDYLKEVCRLAGIDEKHTFTRTVGGKLVSETKAKYELVSSHTGRRSFCTNMYKRGLDTMMIRSISGHKTEKSFLTYIKISEEEHAEMMAKRWNEIYK